MSVSNLRDVFRLRGSDNGLDPKRHRNRSKNERYRHRKRRQNPSVTKLKSNIAHDLVMSAGAALVEENLATMCRSPPVQPRPRTQENGHRSHRAGDGTVTVRGGGADPYNGSIHHSARKPQQRVRSVHEPELLQPPYVFSYRHRQGGQEHSSRHRSTTEDEMLPQLDQEAGRDLLNTVWKGHSPSNRAYGGEASAPSLTTIKVSKQRPNHEQHILFVAGSTDAENAESKIATAGSPSTHQSLQAHSEIRSELEQASSNLNIFNSGNEPTGEALLDSATDGPKKDDSSQPRPTGLLRSYSARRDRVTQVTKELEAAVRTYSASARGRRSFQLHNRNRSLHRYSTNGARHGSPGDASRRPLNVGIVKDEQRPRSPEFSNMFSAWEETVEPVGPWCFE